MKKMKSFLCILLALGMIFALAACGNSAAPAAAPHVNARHTSAHPHIFHGQELFFIFHFTFYT